MPAYTVSASDYDFVEMDDTYSRCTLFLPNATTAQGPSDIAGKLREADARQEASFPTEPGEYSAVMYAALDDGRVVTQTLTGLSSFAPSDGGLEVECECPGQSLEREVPQLQPGLAAQLLGTGRTALHVFHTAVATDDSGEPCGAGLQHFRGTRS
jgi:hypothetical protein